MSDEPLQVLIQTHLARYPESEIVDVYKLLHQATFGPGHLIASKKATREWLERESELLTPSTKAPLVESIHPDGQIVRLHLRPYLAYGGQIKLLLNAFVRSAEQVQGEPDTMARRWEFFEGLCQPGAIYADRFDLQEVVLFGRIRTREGWSAMHHSPAYQAAHKPYYRVLTRAEAEDLCGKIDAPWEVV
jgi:hypothetical protein